MIRYWDNAATTFPKPPAVVAAVNEAMRLYGANPGRGGHRLAMAAAERVYACREAAAEFFGLSDPTGVIFTPGCTASLNMVIQGIAGGGRVVTSDLEHNAVCRPLAAMAGIERRGVAAWSPDAEETAESFRRAIRPDTRLVVCTHASNVFGVTFPLRRLAALAHESGALFCVDAAQTAGVLPIDMEQDGIDYLCVAAHKGLYAPMGVGLLLCRERNGIPPLIRGGTGSHSLSAEQPRELPDRLESGTLNLPGIVGLTAGIRFVRERGREAICRHEIGLLQRLYDGLSELPAVHLYTPRPVYGETAPVLSVNIDGVPSEQVAAALDCRGIAVRAGLHCAPSAHRRFGTLPDGTVRFAPSAFNTEREVGEICRFFRTFR